MNRHFLFSLFILTLMWNVTRSSAVLADDGPKKLQVKPPLPDSDFDEPIVPPMKKEVSPELLPVPKSIVPNEPFDIIVVAAAEGSRPAGSRIGVGLFNHSDRDILLEIDNRIVKLGSKHYVQIKMPREFSWREKEGPMLKTKVPSESDGVEIVFRK